MNNVDIFDDERLDKVNEKIELIIKKDGLTFGTDAYLLASFIRPQPSARAAELGAGTGIISLLLASRERLSHIYAIEIQEDFSRLIERNVLHNGLNDKVSVLCKDVRDIRAQNTDGELDVVFSNPPYMRTDSGKRNASDRKYIARHEVFGDIGDFCLSANRLLKHGGKFYCVWRPDRLSELMGAMRDNRLEPKTMIFVHADEESEPSMVLVSATKGGAPSMHVLPPLILHSADSRGDRARKMSKKAENIYNTMSFYE